MNNQPITDAALAELDRLQESVVKGDNWKEIQQFFALCKQHLPALRERLRIAEAERGMWVNCYIAELEGRAEGHGQALLAARDARMKREGAAEWIEDFSDDLDRQPEAVVLKGVIQMLRSEAAKLREGK